MPLGEQFAATLLVTIDGTALPADVSPLLIGGYIDSARNAPDMFVLRFSDDHGIVLPKSGVKIGSAVKLRLQSSDPGGAIPLLDGEVTALEVEVDTNGTHVVVRGLDLSHRLLHGRRMEAYLDVTASDVVRKIAQRSGLRVGKLDATSSKYKHLTQDNISDWELAQRLAEREGRVLRIADGALDFVKPTDASGAPAQSGGARTNALVLEKGVNLLSVRATLTSSSQVPEVEVRSWDPTTKKALVATKPAKTTSASPAGTTPAKLGQAFSGTKWVVAATGLTDQAQVTARATALADDVAAGFAELEGVAQGNPTMHAGIAVTLSGIGPMFDGTYALSAVRHEFSAESGFTTSFTVAGSAERSLFGAAGGGHRPPRGTVGVLPAIVTSVKDPDSLGRVKVKLPTYSDTYESWWARTVQPGAGASTRGTAMLPEVNDEVLVAFGQGELGQPYILGGLYNGKDKPASDLVGGNDGSVQRRAFQSRTGMRVEYIEKPGAEELVVSTTAGKQMVRLVQKPDAAIEIVSEGPLKVTAKKAVTVEGQQDITVSTASGAVNIKGKDVVIEGSASVKLKTAQLSMEGSASAELKGATVKVAGQGSAELSASGPTTVRGAIVKIN
ncbi:MAG: VgrG-related protein [Brevundimonas sp.]